MIETARRAYPAGMWVLGDAASWKPGEPVDLVFANAVLQWLPDHEKLCRRLFDQVVPGGALAVQVPALAHYDSPIHRGIIAVSEDPAWNDLVKGARNRFTRQPASLY